MVVVNNTMGLFSLIKLKYKNYFNYPLQIRIPDKKRSGTKCSSFHSAIKTTIVIGQCFGLNPVLGICEKNASKLRFKYSSGRFMYTFITLIGQISLVGFLISRLFQTTLSGVDSGTAVIFYGLNLTTTVLFLRLAMKWPGLCMEISEMEAADPTTDSKLCIKFNITSFVILTLAVLEHIFAELHGIALATECVPGAPVYQTFLQRSFPWVFDVIKYNHYVGVLVHFINIQCTFNWNYTDVFVICMSTYLTSRLQQINRRVTAAKDKNLSPSFWRTIREDYNKAAYMVRRVDKIIGGVIFVSFANNLFFITSQLLHALAQGIGTITSCRDGEDLPDRRLLKGYEHSIYFVYSFVFLVVRSVAVSLLASRVHLASLEPAYALYDVSSGTYCIEVERFLDQVHGSTIALSGLQFFNIKRGIILSIAGTIVTYELVLMQFTGVTPRSP